MNTFLIEDLNYFITLNKAIVMEIINNYDWYAMIKVLDIKDCNAMSTIFNDHNTKAYYHHDTNKFITM